MSGENQKQLGLTPHWLSKVFQNLFLDGSLSASLGPLWLGTAQGTLLSPSQIESQLKMRQPCINLL